MLNTIRVECRCVCVCVTLWTWIVYMYIFHLLVSILLVALFLWHVEHRVPCMDFMTWILVIFMADVYIRFCTFLLPIPFDMRENKCILCISSILQWCVCVCFSLEMIFFFTIPPPFRSLTPFLSLSFASSPRPIHFISRPDILSLYDRISTIRLIVHLDDELKYLIAYLPFEKSIKCFLTNIITIRQNNLHLFLHYTLMQSYKNCWWK